MHVLMVGCGNMGASLLARWVDVPGMTYSVADPVATFPDSRVKSFKSAEDVEGGPFDLLIIAVKPQMIADVIPDYLEVCNAGCAGAFHRSRCFLRASGVDRGVAFCGPRDAEYPCKRRQGREWSAISMTRHRTVLKKQRVQMMKAAGTIVEVDEEFDLDKVTAIAGSGPGYVFEIARAYMEAAKELGFEKEQARILVLDTIAGTIEMAAGSTERPGRHAQRRDQ
jgi:pyrroline-5-carboxylate reductase